MFNLTFTGAPVITHNGTSLKIPGQASITIVAGDQVRVESLGSGNNQIQVFRETGAALAGGPLLLSSQEASSSPSIDFESFITSLYDEYEIRFFDVLAQTDDATLVLRTSTNNGSSYDSGASDYRSAGTGLGSDSATQVNDVSNAATFIAIGDVSSTFGYSNVAGETGSGKITISNPLSTATRPIINWQV